MSFSFLRSVLKSNHSERPRVEPAFDSTEPAGDLAGHEGTPFTPLPRHELLRGCEEILRRIRLCYGREPEHFEQDILAIVVRYADYVNALPATANNYYSYPGGLLRLGLDTAFFSLQATDAQIFEGRSTITQRRHLEPRWRHATFIAGLCAALQPTLNTLQVRVSPEECWSSYLQPLASWLALHGKASFHLLWHPPSHIDGLQNLYALSHIVPPATMEFLAERNDVIVPTMLATLSRLPLSHPPITMSALVRRAAALAIAKDLRRMASKQGTRLQGEHLGRLLVDIMHDLVHSAASWTPNSDKSRVWHTHDGTLIVWPDAYQDIAAYADHDRINGLPTDAESALEALHSAGMVTSDDNCPLWTFRVPGGSADRSCLKLAFPELVLGAQLRTCSPLPQLCRRRVHAEPDEAGTPPFSEVEQASASKPTDSEDRPSQLELHLAQATGEELLSATMAPVEAHEAPPIRPALVNCMRLPADVTGVIRHAVANLLAAGVPAKAHLVSEGILIPVDVLKSAGLEIRTVARGLRDAGMLVAGKSGTPVHTITVDGIELRGLVLSRQYVTGIPSA